MRRRWLRKNAPPAGRVTVLVETENGLLIIDYDLGGSAMARTIPDPPEPPPGVELSPIPNIEGHIEAAEWISTALSIPATPRWIHEMTIQGRIRYSKLMGKRFYSTQELYRFVMAQEKVGGSK
jgi:hypothetical protein